jgi:hypothetical protein
MSRLIRVEQKLKVKNKEAKDNIDSIEKKSSCFVGTKKKRAQKLKRKTALLRKKN